MNLDARILERVFGLEATGTRKRSLALVFCWFLCACDTRHSTFVEPVELSDGRIIHLKRKQTFERTGQWASPYWVLYETRLRVVQGGFPSHEWKERGVAPMLLEIDGGSLVLVGLVKFTLPNDKRLVPTPPYVQFRLTADGWIDEPVSARFWGRERNLIYDASNWGELTLEQKRRLLTINRPTLRQNRRIDPDTFLGDDRP